MNQERNAGTLPSYAKHIARQIGRRSADLNFFNNRLNNARQNIGDLVLGPELLTTSSLLKSLVNELRELGFNEFTYYDAQGRTYCILATENNAFGLIAWSDPGDKKNHMIQYQAEFNPDQPDTLCYFATSSYSYVDYGPDHKQVTIKDTLRYRLPKRLRELDYLCNMFQTSVNFAKGLVRQTQNIDGDGI